MAIPTTMRAVAIDSFGGVDKLQVRSLPVPTVDAGEVLIKLAYAGVAVWDPIHREGYFEPIVKQMTGKATTFPLVLGTEGAGAVAAVGAGVTSVKVGDAVYTSPFLNPKGGLYAEYASVKADVVRLIPKGMSAEAASTFSGDAGTALRGLQDVLKVARGEHVLIFGAGGGIGHLAVQLAKRLGARVLAVASGADGVELAKRVGADRAIDGRKEDIAAAAKAFAPGGIDVVLLTAGGPAAEAALKTLKPGGRAAYPHGVQPEPKVAGVEVKAYDGDITGELLSRLDPLVNAGPFVVNVARVFSMDQAADAHRFLDEHYLGKLTMKVG